jgi:undecaprenyl-diphosphatase
VAALVVVAGAALRGRRRLALTVLLAWAVVRATSAAMKLVVDRGRPPELVDDVVLRQHLPFDQGFPSAHSATAAAVAVVLARAHPRLRVPLAVLAGLVGVARLYVGVHLPLDLVGGWCLGVVGGLAAVAAVDRWTPGASGSARPPLATGPPSPSPGCR